MAVIDTARVAHTSNGGFSLLNNIMAAFSAWNDVRQTRIALGQLSNRELEDIGLCRGDIDTVAIGSRNL